VSSPGTVPRVGDLVEVLSLEAIRATLDAEGALEGLPFMPEMVRHCGKRLRVSAVMDRICGGGPGMRTVAGAPLVRLEDLRCGGDVHGECSRGCTLLWKPGWLRVPGGAGASTSAPDPVPSPWPYPLRSGGGGWICQATGLAAATAPISAPRKVLSGVMDVGRGAWSAGELARVYLETVEHKLARAARRARPAGGRTPVDRLDLAPGEWVEVKRFAEISPTLDREGKNRGLEFSRYMVPFCGGTYRVSARMENFIDERDGSMRRLENTVLLEGVACGGGTPAGPCRRLEWLYWREIWLRRVPGPPESKGARAT